MFTYLYVCVCVCVCVCVYRLTIVMFARLGVKVDQGFPFVCYYIPRSGGKPL